MHESFIGTTAFGCGVQKPVDDVLKPEEPTFIEGGTDNNEKNGEEIIYVDPAEKFRQLMSQSIAEISICRSYNIPNMFILHETLQSSESEQFIQILNSFTSVKNIDLQGKKFDEVYPSSERLTGNEIKVSFENESMDLYMFVSLYLYEDRAYFVTKNECYELKFENMELLTGFIQQVLPVYWMSEEQYQQLKAEAPFADENSPECPSEEWFSFIDEEGLIKNRYYFKGNHDEDEDYDYQKALGVVNYMDPITASVNEFQYLFETAPKSSLFEARKEGEKTFLVGKGLKSSDPEYEMNKQSLKTEQGLNYYGIMKGNDFRTQYQSFFGKQGGLDESQTWFKKRFKTKYMGIH